MAIKKVVLCITVNRLNVTRQWVNEHCFTSSMLEPAGCARITMWRTDLRTGIEEKAMEIEIELTKVSYMSNPLEFRVLDEQLLLLKPDASPVSESPPGRPPAFAPGLADIR